MRRWPGWLAGGAFAAGTVVALSWVAVWHTFGWGVLAAVVVLLGLQTVAFATVDVLAERLAGVQADPPGRALEVDGDTPAPAPAAAPAGEPPPDYED